jgi:DnaJ-class molecular chaperone
MPEIMIYDAIAQGWIIACPRCDGSGFTPAGNDCPDCSSSGAK